MRSVFSLKPFSESLPAGLTITGGIARDSNMLSVSYELSGPLGEIDIPAPAERPERRHGLWKETCLEFFISEERSDKYWEFNLSPAGHWNVYRFDACRQGMRQEDAFASLPFETGMRGGLFFLSLELCLDRMIQADQKADAGISAVIRSKSGGMTYWALTHPGPEPDFHRRDGFIIEL